MAVRTIGENYREAETYSKPCQTSKMTHFVKIVNDFEPIAIFVKHSISHVLLRLPEVIKNLKIVSFKLLNPFVPNAPFLYPIKPSENITVALGTNGLRVHWQRMS